MGYIHDDSNSERRTKKKQRARIPAELFNFPSDVVESNLVAYNSLLIYDLSSHEWERLKRAIREATQKADTQSKET